MRGAHTRYVGSFLPSCGIVYELRLIKKWFLFCADPQRLPTLAGYSARTRPADAESPDERVCRPPRKRDGLPAALARALAHALARTLAWLVGLVRLVVVAQVGRVPSTHERERQWQRQREHDPRERGACAQDERAAVYHGRGRDPDDAGERGKERKRERKGAIESVQGVHVEDRLRA